MQSTRLAFDPLWQCLCPSWTTATHSRTLGGIPKARPAALFQCLNAPTRRRYAAEAAPATQPHKPFYDKGPNARRLEAASRHWDASFDPTTNKPARVYKEEHQAWRRKPSETKNGQLALSDLDSQTSMSLHDRLHLAAINGKYEETQQIVEYLVKHRKERPSLELYNALILANISFDEGAAWRVYDLLGEMQQDGLQPDAGVCHAVLKVLSVHTDHLLRTDMLEYMRIKWITLTDRGAHDIAAGLLREGALEQALERLDMLQEDGVPVERWLLDMFVYALCEGGEVDEAHAIMQTRHRGGEVNMSRTLWHYMLDKASAAYHLEATLFAWKTQVNLGYLNPNSGICLNVLTTASRAGDAALATDVFTHLSKRGETFTPLHYQLLLEAYLSASPPDLKRALSILTIMPMENLEPTPWQTRRLFKLLRRRPDLTSRAFDHLRALHADNRTIPIAALNLIIECYVEQHNLAEALKVYKLIHTLAPITSAPAPTFANIETFNLLLRACRTADPPDEAEASFLVSELLALRIQPTGLTYDRLILVFVRAGEYHLERSQTFEDPTASADHATKGIDLLDWAYRHFLDMQPLEWMPRVGTIEKLTKQLAGVGDQRCWDVLQMAEDAGEERIEGWRSKSRWAKENAEQAWLKFEGAARAQDASEQTQDVSLQAAA